MTLEMEDLGDHLHDLTETLSDEDETELEVQDESFTLHPDMEINDKIAVGGGRTRDETLRGDKEGVEISG
jgi:hypothetical protein